MTVEQRVHHVWSRVENWIRQNAAIMLETLAPPADEAQLRELEDLLESPLPEDFAAFYRIHNGQINKHIGWDYSRFLFGEKLWGIAGMIENYKYRLKNPETEIDLGLVDTYGPIAVAWMAHKKWIPFASGSGYQRVLLDLEPPKNGTYGQVFVSCNDAVSNRWLAASFADYLEAFALALEAGLYTFWECEQRGEKGIVLIEHLDYM